MPMSLPIQPPVRPMLAKRIRSLPPGDEWIFEPKWDGFRAIVFIDGTEVYLQSRGLKPLARYFPELLEPLSTQLPGGAVLDAEIVIERGGVLDFEALQMRLHPAASRVERLAREIPAAIVCFDVLADGQRDVRSTPFAERRSALESLLEGARPPLYLTPATRDRTVAADWFKRFEGAGLDGVMAKRAAGVYEPRKRAMLKVKHARECDCVVAGFRWHKTAPGEAVGSLLLGLYDDQGRLQHVGVCGAFKETKRRELVAFLEPYRVDALHDHPWRDWAADDAHHGSRQPGAVSRWSQGKDLSWEPLRVELVAEVGYDHMQSGRFRHTAHFRRWRDDKLPGACTFDQLEVVPPHELASFFAAG